MNRRHFLQQAAQAAMIFPFLKPQPFLRPEKMGVIVHSYAHRWKAKVESKRYPAFSDAIDLIAHCSDIGAGGVQVMVHGWSNDFARKVREKREHLGLFIEGSIVLPKDGADVDRFDREVTAAREAGASVIRTVCLSGRRYETFQTLDMFLAFKQHAIRSLRLAEPVMRKYRMKLAVENHKDWRTGELVSILKDLDSEWVGVNLDFGNNIALMEEPMDVVRQLAPYLMTTHVKDMGVEEYPDGFLLSEVPLGQGFLELKNMFDVCRKHCPDVNFNLEMITRDPLKIPCLTKGYWSTFSDTRPDELAGTLRMVREHPYHTALPRVSSMDPQQRLAREEDNVVASLQYSKSTLGLE